MPTTGDHNLLLEVRTYPSGLPIAAIAPQSPGAHEGRWPLALMLDLLGEKSRCFVKVLLLVLKISEPAMKPQNRKVSGRHPRGTGPGLMDTIVGRCLLGPM